MRDVPAVSIPRLRASTKAQRPQSLLLEVRRGGFPEDRANAGPDRVHFGSDFSPGDEPGPAYRAYRASLWRCQHRVATYEVVKELA